MNSSPHPLKAYIPEAAIEYIDKLLADNPILIRVTAERKHFHGTFRDKNKSGRYRIGVSGTLNPYAFLITLVHEIAHLKTFQLHGRKIMPHGIEWKNIFTNLMLPLVRDEVFPNDIKEVLVKHFQNPKASSSSDPALVKVLAKYNSNKKNTVFLDELSHGEHFIFDSREFVKDEIRRKRILCYDAKTKRKYLFNPVAEVSRLRS